ncbi:hypothetical protein PO909_009020 [Leuciscus waleckii]
MEPCLRSVCRESLRKVSMKCWTWRSVKCSRSSFKRPLTAACGRTHHSTLLLRAQGPCSTTRGTHLFLLPDVSCRQRATDASQAALSSVAPVFVVMKFERDGNVTSFEKKKTELYQELSLQARDLRFQHLTSITARNNAIIIRMESMKAVVTPECLLVLDFRGLGLEKWLVLELGPQLAGDGNLATYSLPFEFRALEAILQHRVNLLQMRLNEVQPQVLDCLESLVDPKLLSADRSKLHLLLLNSKSLSELETDIRMFKESLLKILDEDELIDELCVTKWSDPQVFEESSLGIDHAEEMELLLENYFMQAEELGNKARELKDLIDDSESVIFINLDRNLPFSSTYMLCKPSECHDAPEPPAHHGNLLPLLIWSDGCGFWNEFRIFL